MTSHVPPEPDSTLAQGIPLRWWTEGEVRAILARRASLDHVGLVTAEPPVGAHWRCCFSVDGGAIELRALVSLAGPADDSVPEGAVPIVPPPGGSDAAHIGLRIEGAAPTVVFELRVRAGPYLRQVELSLPPDWYAALPPHPDLTVSLVRLHGLLWAELG